MERGSLEGLKTNKSFNFIFAVLGILGNIGVIKFLKCFEIGGTPDTIIY